jgi:hypothetical protein
LPFLEKGNSVRANLESMNALNTPVGKVEVPGAGPYFMLANNEMIDKDLLIKLGFAMAQALTTHGTGTITVEKLSSMTIDDMYHALG